MTGKRNWRVVHRQLSFAVESKIVRGTALRELIYVPEFFILDQKDLIAKRRSELLHKATPPVSGPRRLMIVVGDVKEIRPARFGFRLLLKHAPDFPLLLTDELHRRLTRKFAPEIAAWTAFDGVHLVAIATFEVDIAGVPGVEDISVMTTTVNWLPFEGARERMLIESLVGSGRRFTKILRYILQPHVPVAAAMLTDTYPVATALYLHPEADNESSAGALADLIVGSNLSHWSWHAAEVAVPPLPALGP